MDVVLTWPHRKVAVWLAWLDLQWDRPSRSDCYVMQAGHAAAEAMAKKRTTFRVKEWILKFAGLGGASTPASRTKLLKNQMRAAFGRPVPALPGAADGE